MTVAETKLLNVPRRVERDPLMMMLLRQEADRRHFRNRFGAIESRLNALHHNTTRIAEKLEAMSNPVEDLKKTTGPKDPKRMSEVKAKDLIDRVQKLYERLMGFFGSNFAVDPVYDGTVEDADAADLEIEPPTSLDPPSLYQFFAEYCENDIPQDIDCIVCLADFSGQNFDETLDTLAEDVFGLMVDDLLSQSNLTYDRANHVFDKPTEIMHAIVFGTQLNLTKKPANTPLQMPVYRSALNQWFESEGQTLDDDLSSVVIKEPENWHALLANWTMMHALDQIRDEGGFENKERAREILLQHAMLLYSFAGVVVAVDASETHVGDAHGVDVDYAEIWDSLQDFNNEGEQSANHRFAQFIKQKPDSLPYLMIFKPGHWKVIKETPSSFIYDELKKWMLSEAKTDTAATAANSSFDHNQVRQNDKINAELESKLASIYSVVSYRKLDQAQVEEAATNYMQSENGGNSEGAKARAALDKFFVDPHADEHDWSSLENYMPTILYILVHEAFVTDPEKGVAKSVDIDRLSLFIANYRHYQETKLSGN